MDAPPPSKPPAWKKYYEAHKEEIKAKMRERNAKQREEERLIREMDEDAAEEQRQNWRVKYAMKEQRSVKKQIDAWLTNEGVVEEFKTFLRRVMLPENAYRNLTPKMIKVFESLPIYSPAAPSL